MINELICDVTKRHDYVFEITVEKSNPNGDPLADNMPRIDDEGYGEITDGCIKRKIRDVAESAFGQTIFIRKGSYLNDAIEEAHNAVEDKTIENKQQYMLNKYWDIRMFGGVLSTGKNAGKVQGAMSMSHATSLEPVEVREYSITRCAGTDAKGGKNAEERAKKSTKQVEKEDKLAQSMGRYYLVKFGIYQGYGTFDTFLAKKTGVTNDDLQVFWESLIGAFRINKAKNRVGVRLSSLIVFTHEQPLGNQCLHTLLKYPDREYTGVTITKVLITE